jgi:transcription elongation factor Elf1
MQKENMKWLLCPLCGNKTRNKIREDTILKNYPLYCPKCKQEVLIEVKDLQVTIIKEPDALDAEPMNE